MPARVSESVRISQINSIPNIEFIRWDTVYRNNLSKAVVKCTLDGFEWPANISNMINHGKGCPMCAGNRRWSSDERISHINNIEGVTFVRWVGKYRNKSSKLIARCDCGHEWVTGVSNLLHDHSGCPMCVTHGYDKSKVGTLYALRSSCGTMVKIGISNEYSIRLARLKRVTPFDWDCIELCHGDGMLIASLEKVLHDMMVPVTFSYSFEGCTEWRVWDSRIYKWFDLYRDWS